MADDLRHKLKKYAAYLQAHPRGEKVFAVLRKLTSLPVSVKLLQETKIGKIVHGFCKREGETGVFAKTLVAAWKLLVKKAVSLKAKAEKNESDSDRHSVSDAQSDSVHNSDNEEGSEAGSRQTDHDAADSGNSDAEEEAEEEDVCHSEGESSEDGSHFDKKSDVGGQGGEGLSAERSGSEQEEVSDGKLDSHRHRHPHHHQRSEHSDQRNSSKSSSHRLHSLGRDRSSSMDSSKRVHVNNQRKNSGFESVSHSKDRKSSGKEGASHKKSHSHQEKVSSHKESASRHKDKASHKESGTHAERSSHKNETSHIRENTSQHMDNTSHHQNSKSCHKESASCHEDRTSLHKENVSSQKEQKSHHKDSALQHKESSSHHKDSTARSKDIPSQGKENQSKGSHSETKATGDVKHKSQERHTESTKHGSRHNGSNKDSEGDIRDASAVSERREHSRGSSRSKAAGEKQASGHKSSGSDRSAKEKQPQSSPQLQSSHSSDKKLRNDSKSHRSGSPDTAERSKTSSSNNHHSGRHNSSSHHSTKTKNEADVHSSANRLDKAKSSFNGHLSEGSCSDDGDRQNDRRHTLPLNRNVAADDDGEVGNTTLRENKQRDKHFIDKPGGKQMHGVDADRAKSQHRDKKGDLPTPVCSNHTSTSPRTVPSNSELLEERSKSSVSKHEDVMSRSSTHKHAEEAFKSFKSKHRGGESRSSSTKDGTNEHRAATSKPRDVISRPDSGRDSNSHRTHTKSYNVPEETRTQPDLSGEKHSGVNPSTEKSNLQSPGRTKSCSEEYVPTTEKAHSDYKNALSPDKHKNLLTKIDPRRVYDAIKTPSNESIKGEKNKNQPSGKSVDGENSSGKNLFETLGKCLHSNEKKAQESSQLDSGEDYECLVDNWIEEGIAEYKPSPVKRKDNARLRHESIEDYEEHIDRQLEKIFAEYKPGSKPTAGRQSDDYGDYIDKRLKKDCVEYKPGSIKPEKMIHTNRKSAWEQSPEDYGDFIDEKLQRECAEYKPGVRQSNTSLSHRSSRELSPEDYGDFIDRKLEKGAAQYRKATEKELSKFDYGESDCVKYKPSAKSNSSQDVRKQESSSNLGNSSCHHEYQQSRTSSSHRKKDQADTDSKNRDCSLSGHKFDAGKEQTNERQSHRSDHQSHRSDHQSHRSDHQRNREGDKKDDQTDDRREKRGDTVSKHRDRSEKHGDTISKHRDRSSHSGSSSERPDKAVKVRLDGKHFQEPGQSSASVTASSKPSKRSYHAVSDSESDAEVDTKRHLLEEVETLRTSNQVPNKKVNSPTPPLSEHKKLALPSSQKEPQRMDSSKVNKPKSGSTKRSSRYEMPSLEQDLFSAPDDHSIKVPAKKHRTLVEKKNVEKSSDAKKTERGPSTSSNTLTGMRDSASASRDKEKSRTTSVTTSSKTAGDVRASSDVPKPKPSPKVQRRSPSPASEEDDASASFEDFLNYDEKKAIKKKKVEKLPPPSGTSSYALSLPPLVKQLKLTDADILGSTGESYPVYRPRPPPPNLDGSRHNLSEDDNAISVGHKNTRTQVYSGRRHGLTEVKPLFQLCMQVLTDNIDAIDYVGGLPYDVLKPVLDRATAQQLYRLEECNPQFLQDTDHLWKQHCERDFRDAQRGEDESWREVYEREFHAREAKYQKLRDNMSKVMTKGQKGRKVCMAFMDTVAKPPREVRRQQQRYGTAGVVHSGSTSSIASKSALLKHKGYIPMKPQGGTEQHQPLPFSRPFVKPQAPMMQKVKKLMSQVRRH